MRDLKDLFKNSLVLEELRPIHGVCILHPRLLSNALAQST